MNSSGSPWQNIIMDSLLLLFPEKRSELSQYLPLNIKGYANSHSVLEVALVMRGQTSKEPAAIIHVAIDRLLSGLGMVINERLAPSILLDAPEEEVTEGK